MESSLPFPLEAVPNQSKTINTKVNRNKILQRFYNLPIRNKQLLGLFTSEVISILGLVGVGALLIVSSGQSQLRNQAKSELVVTQLNYNTKIDQMGFGFRGQSDNFAIIAAANQGDALTPDLKQKVKKILQNEIKAREIEYATLVGRDLTVIVNANEDRTGEFFNPNNLVDQVFRKPEQIKSSEIVSWSELIKESPPLPPNLMNQDALIRYTVTPVKNPNTNNVIAALVSGDIVNSKSPIVEKTLEAFGGGYSAIYLRKPDGDFILTTAKNQSQNLGSDSELNQVNLPDQTLLKEAVISPGETVTKRIAIGKQTYTMAAIALENFAGDPIAVLVRGTPEVQLNELLKNSLLLQLLVSALALTADVFLAIFLGKTIVKPVKQLQSTAQEFSQGNRQARAEILADDEFGQLANTFNQMADSIDSNIEEISLKEIKIRQEVEQARSLQQSTKIIAEEQRQIREMLQKRAVELLKEVDLISKGDLTIKAKVTADEIGTIADAYNVTVSSLRQVVTQVQAAAQQVTTSTMDALVSVESLSVAALQGESEMAAALDRTQVMAESVKDVATKAEQAETFVKQATQKVQLGDTAMNRTVDGMMAIRETVAQTRQKVKRLGESSQKISAVVNLINSFAEQSNLLALNASIEAARAGEGGKGFAVVASQVRSLAQQSATATSEIEELVSEIQAETNEVVVAMETGTEQVVMGTQLVNETRHNLNQITAASNDINRLVKEITRATFVQSVASEAVTQTITNVAEIASKTSQEAEVVSSAFEQLSQVAQTLQANASKFKV
ncbi:MAG: HAMP domain-containing protein [Symploca sp. SIO1C4]|uniref:HAMP domain-containing protein n=1 Tax=Symploca sp. SIO1C4 TaxID=2607765 RepID=A0A6B3NF99_9CYAN|nr:HAMP domain-containing protein [Symploca sp. SIO1C4]